jgi:membrane protein YdbS with pleckstrin-like domain
MLLVCAAVSIALELFKPPWIAAVAACLVLFCFIFSIYLPKRYKSFRYAVGNKEVVVRRGVFVRNTSYLPRGNIQLVTRTSTFHERIFRLSTVIVYTAGKAGYLPGLSEENAEKIVNLLSGFDKTEDL